MKRRTTALVILFALAAILILLAQANIHAGPAPQADAREVLMKADADFDAAVAEKGIDAWVASFAEDGLMFRAGEPVHGRAAIRELMAPAFATPGFSLRWKPVAADIAASGDLGYTYGNLPEQLSGSRRQAGGADRNVRHDLEEAGGRIVEGGSRSGERRPPARAEEGLNSRAPRCAHERPGALTSAQGSANPAAVRHASRQDRDSIDRHECRRLRNPTCGIHSTGRDREVLHEREPHSRSIPHRHPLSRL